MRHVVEVAHVLGVVAQAIGEEIRFGLHAADVELIAHAFAHVDGNARRIAHGFGQRLHALVAQDFLGDDLDGLRDVDQWGVGAGGGRGARNEVLRRRPAGDPYPRQLRLVVFGGSGYAGALRRIGRRWRRGGESQPRRQRAGKAGGEVLAASSLDVHRGTPGKMMWEGARSRGGADHASPSSRVDHRWRHAVLPLARWKRRTHALPARTNPTVQPPVPARRMAANVWHGFWERADGCTTAAGTSGRSVHGGGGGWQRRRRDPSRSAKGHLQDVVARA